MVHDLEKDKGKWHLEILDFRNATSKFKDPAFDGDPEPPKGGGKKPKPYKIIDAPEIPIVSEPRENILSAVRIFALPMKSFQC